MVRMAKDPEERKAEIVSAAEELFLTKGYEQTAVSDIVKKVGVAQGLFYYYFKCKEEILNAIAEKYINHIVKGVKRVLDNEKYNALQKVDKLIDALFEEMGLRRKGIKGFINYMHKEENSVTHQRIAARTVGQLVPLIVEVVKQGVNEEVFNTSYPDEVTEILVTWAGMLHNSIKLPVADPDSFKRKTAAIEESVERMLGAKKGTIQLMKYAEEVINQK